MSLFCDDGVPAEITPWVPIPLDAKGKRIWPLEPERDRCQRPICRKLEWQHWTMPPLSDVAREALRRIIGL